MKTSCGIRLMHEGDVMVEKQRETQEVAGRIKRIPQACGDLPRRFTEDFWKLEHCPDAVRLVASAGLIAITPPLPCLPYTATCFLSMAPL